MRSMQEQGALAEMVSEKVRRTRQTEAEILQKKTILKSITTDILRYILQTIYLATLDFRERRRYICAVLYFIFFFLLNLLRPLPEVEPRKNSHLFSRTSFARARKKLCFFLRDLRRSSEWMMKRTRKNENAIE